MVGLTSVGGYLALLDESSNELRYFALEKINELVDQFWAEIASDIQKIEQLYEDESFQKRELAALVASKVYYHLGENAEAMNFALGAGKLFDVTSKSEYVETLVSKFIDEYVKLRLEHSESKEESSKKAEIDARLERIVMGMFDRCYKEKSYNEALGIAIESRRLDKVEETLTKSDDIHNMLVYCMSVCLYIVKHKGFRQDVLNIIVRLFKTLAEPDYVHIVQCLVFLDDPNSVVQILSDLVKGRRGIRDTVRCARSRARRVS
eukprot:TRINITY_DN27017_c0_g1_i1.p1 TRINITY_DN27017_c0_g1~~TRINITY_DN27017_c0_g1_i1.p1  ORF type:complete len:263 (+),score=28.68 TRINITY_DN27017_c0_g1_i1:55-843(+)